MNFIPENEGCAKEGCAAGKIARKIKERKQKLTAHAGAERAAVAEEKGERKKLVSGAAILGAGTFLAKIIGAAYRVPLTALLGGAGIGLYQLVFPVYTVLLDFSGAGAPSALSKLIASGDKAGREERAKDYLFAGLKLFAALGAVFSLFMFLFAKPLSAAQGDENAYLSYAAISPAVFLVCLITPFRGYFQGLANMKPTAISQIIEQTVKLCFGLMLVKLFGGDTPRSAAGAAFAITVSEAAAAIYLFSVYKARQKRARLGGALFNGGVLLNGNTPAFCGAPINSGAPLNGETPAFGGEQIAGRESGVTAKLIKTAIPVTLLGIIFPLCAFAESFIVINLLSGYKENSTALYGLYSGVASTIAGLPAAVCYGVAAAAIPAVSAGKTEEKRKKNSAMAIALTLFLSLPAAAVLYFFAPNIINLLFRSLPQSEREISARLLKILAPSAALLSLLQTQNAVLIAENKPYFAVLSMAIGAAVKISAEIILVKNPSFNVYGCAVAVIACYFCVDLVNFIALQRKPAKLKAEGTANADTADKNRESYRAE